MLETTAIVGLAGIGVLYVMSRSSETGFLMHIADHEAALLIDNRTGEVRATDTPGYQVLIPWIQDGYWLDKSPIEYRMEGDAWANHNQVPRLVVRASDGAKFSFDTVQIQYAIRPESAYEVTRLAGAGYGWHHGPMDAYARAILADEFGRHTAEEIARAEVLRDATLRAKERLGAALDGSGLAVREILTSKPLFAAEYESVVQRRKVADREVEQLAQQIEQLRASRETRLAKLRRSNELQAAASVDELGRKLARAERDAERDRVQADTAYDARIRAAEKRRVELISQADASVQKYTKEAEGFRAKADALAAQGELAVRQRLIENLKKVEFTIEPFDAAGADAGQSAHFLSSHQGGL